MNEQEKILADVAGGLTPREIYERHRARSDATRRVFRGHAVERLDVGATVEVAALYPRRMWTAEARLARAEALRADDVRGVVVAIHDSHGLCYDVLHVGGRFASYDHDELQVVAP